MKKTIETNRWGSDVYHCEVEPKKYIRLAGTYSNRAKPFSYDITFKVGDTAVYDSYNLTYVGKIVSIGEKTITILHGTKRQPDRTRLTLAKFAWRNFNFDLEKINRENNIERMFI